MKDHYTEMDELYYNTITQLDLEIENYILENPHIRKGQARFSLYYNSIFFKEFCNKIRGTEYDCFYDDNKIEAFNKHLMEKFGI